MLLGQLSSAGDLLQRGSRLLAGRLAQELVDTLRPEDLRGVTGLSIVSDNEVTSPFNFGKALDRLRSLVERDALGPTTSSLVREAERRGTPGDVSRRSQLPAARLWPASASAWHPTARSRDHVCGRFLLSWRRTLTSQHSLQPLSPAVPCAARAESRPRTQHGPTSTRKCR
jgi:hypothetical protein